MDVSPVHRGKRVDQFLAEVIPELSRSRIQQLLKDGQVQVDGKGARAALRLRGTERVSWSVPSPEKPEAKPEDLPIRILFEDRDLLVVDKKAGMVVHPAAGNWTGTLVNALLHRVEDLQGVGGELRPGLVHRLDKETSGCLVVAKNEATLKALQEAFKSREVTKTYLALVHGAPPPEGTFSTLHGRHPRDRKRFSGKVKVGKSAITHFQTREQFPGAALVEINLETGRTHQIRMHFSEAGLPLLGDALYGGAKRGTGAVKEAMARIGRTALHAQRLEFRHPRSGKKMSFGAPLPEDFERGLQHLRGE